ncbi:MAG: replication-associated recombination protein A [Oscillospiraceae bacterium]
MKPLADELRPKKLEDFVGQKHIIGKNKPLYNLILKNHITNMIFYGTSGTGKTTLAQIIAKNTDKRFYKLNATTATTSDIKQIIEDSSTVLGLNGILLYIDEIQYFNKKQQQTLLEFIETGKITLIASTTENPYFCVFSAILSRCNIFEFKQCETEDIKKVLSRAVLFLEDRYKIKINIKDSVLNKVATQSIGDVRKALGILELCYFSCKEENGVLFIDDEKFHEFNIGGYVKYDKNGDEHYNLLSAFQKSIRGSDENAAIYYLARLVKTGDLISISRRLLVIASEDIGLAYPQSIGIVLSCVESANRLGFPEAQIPLAQAVIFLSLCPKSNTANVSIQKAIEEIDQGFVYDVPDYIKDGHYKGAENLGRGVSYKYPHNYEHNYIKQDYLPKELKSKKYYDFGLNKFESSLKSYWGKIK